MDINQITQEFVDKQRLNGASDNEISESVILANTVAISQTQEELKSATLSVKAQEILKTLEQNPRETTNALTASEFLSEKVNESGETISDVFCKHLKNFLDQL